MKKRVKEIDGLKFLLIIGIIATHMIERFVYIPLFKSLYLIFHVSIVPLFAFLSGFVTKDFSFSNLKKSAVSLLGTYIVFQILFIVLFWWVRGQHPIDNVAKFVNQVILIPEYVLWFLLSLFSWRLLYTLLYKWVSPSVLLIGSIILLIVFSFLPFDQKILSIGRTIYYFPFFVIGAITSEKSLKRIWKSNNLIFLLLIINVVFFIPEISTYPDIQKLVYGSYPINKLEGELDVKVFLRILVLLASVINGWVLLKLSKELRFFNQEGKFTMVYYIFHAIFYIVAFYICQQINFTNIKFQIPILFVLNIGFCYMMARVPNINYIMNPFLLIFKDKEKEVNK